MSNARQETYAHRNNSGLFAGLFYYSEQRTNDEKINEIQKIPTEICAREAAEFCS
jgi:hypothetical protein